MTASYAAMTITFCYENYRKTDPITAWDMSSIQKLVKGKYDTQE
jgi:hypothetical protein